LTRPPVRFRATYRLQLTPEFGFAAARALIPYLRDLGVSHLYLSPSLQARAGSKHGYDVVDPTRISDELGGEDELRALATAAHGAGLGILLDMVPNHMATDESNRFWSDPSLRARFFDIDPETGAHRRFFDIDDLAGVRQEDESVFEETHRLVLGLVREGVIDALRIDHPDGMADPAQYFVRLRDRGVEHVWIEKILEADERLRDWPVSGTVGYEFLNDVCALFVDPDAEPALTSLWEEVSGERRSFDEVASEAKLEQARGSLSREVDRLARVLGEGVGDIGALAASVAAMPIYRTYVEPATGLVANEDRTAIAASGMPAAIAERLLLERDGPAEFVTRFQQTSPAVLAKGVEDTAFYRYARLVALCDVGGDPGRFGISVAAFHARARERAERFPLGMLTTVTHDTKRTADVRARIAGLSWMAAAWEEHVRRWLAVTDELRGDNGAPDDLERYFLFQTLAGAWPIEVERIEAYMEKALREAKRNTNWVEQNLAWEEAVGGFCRELYSHRAFLDDFEPFVNELVVAGDRIALGMLALKLTAPGVPDIYQGDELPLRALVDPDNRRQVDWKWHRAMLSRLQGGSPPDRKTLKLWLTTRLLQLRIRRPHAFWDGGYEPLDAGEHAVAFLRGGEVLVVVATRAAVPDGDCIRGAEGSWRDVLGGGTRTLSAEEPLNTLLGAQGVAVLEL
jgi:(1->4)-alpha-D-glucan 1-alpha-D-glucosylmutase